MKKQAEMTSESASISFPFAYPQKAAVLCFQVGVSSDENFLQSNTLEDLLSTAAAVETVAGPPVVALDNSESPLELMEHQYSLPASDHNVVTVQATADYERRKASSESYFTIYNQIARWSNDNPTDSVLTSE